MLFAVLSAYLAFVQGDVHVIRQGRTLVAAINMRLSEGDHVRTLNGRAQVRFSDDTSLDIEPYTEIAFVTDTRVRVVSALPAELQAYAGALIGYGTWQYVAPYGPVWCPRVGPSWRPYANGYWKGLMWMGADPFAWPTHHYGRWAFDHGRWLWIPAGTPDLYRARGEYTPYYDQSPVTSPQSTVISPQSTVISPPSTVLRPPSTVHSPPSTVMVPAATVSVPRVVVPRTVMAPSAATVMPPPVATPLPVAPSQASVVAPPLAPAAPPSAHLPAPPKAPPAGSVGKSAPKR